MLHLVVGDRGGVSCFNINMAHNDMSIDYSGFPVRIKQALLRELEWLRWFSALHHWVHDDFVFNTGVALATTSSIRVEPGVCPKVEHMEGYFFSPFFFTFLFNSSTPSFPFHSFILFSYHT